MLIYGQKYLGGVQINRLRMYCDELSQIISNNVYSLVNKNKVLAETASDTLLKIQRNSFSSLEIVLHKINIDERVGR